MMVRFRREIDLRDVHGGDFLSSYTKRAEQAPPLQPTEFLRRRRSKES
jgi:hypothetical protein